MGYLKFCSASGMFVENRIYNFDTQIRRLVYGFNRDWCVLETPLLVVSWTAQSGCHQICTDIFSLFHKWSCKHVLFSTFVFFAVIYFVLCKAVMGYLHFCWYKLLSFFSIIHLFFKCYGIYRIPVTVYYVIHVTWKPAIKLLCITYRCAQKIALTSFHKNHWRLVLQEVNTKLVLMVIQ